MKQEHKKPMEIKMKQDLSVAKDEFPESIPVLDYLNDSLQKNKSSRRDFLKTMGFTISAATLAASCEIPVKKALPYVDKPEEITPGKALYFASSYFDGSTFGNILVKTRDGRPIKIEGNKQSPLTKGSTGAAIQASVIGLYDHTRFQSPMVNGKKSDWETALSGLKSELTSVTGEVVLLTRPIISPSLQKAIDTFTAKYNAKHVVYSAKGNDALLLANEQSFGKKAAPTYRFNKADVVVGFAADFLANWLGGSNFYAVDYASKRKVSAENRSMSKHYHVEANHSLTGANADVRFAVKPSAIKTTLFQLYNALGGNISGVPANNGEGFKKMVADLKAAAGNSIVACGLNDIEAQVVTNAINSKLGNYGSTIDFSRTLNFIQGDGTQFEQLATDIKNGKVGALLTFDVNPVYNSPVGQAFADSISKIKTIASFDSSPNETNSYATYVLPNSHYLESWADYEPVTGSFAVAQPTINPIFNTKQVGESLLSLADYSFEEGEGFYEFMASNYEGNFDDVLRSGFTMSSSVDVVSASDSGAGLSNIRYNAPNTSGVEYVVFEDKLGDGEFANNPYMQELPDPMSKAAWGNYVAVSPAFAAANGWEEYNRNVFPGNEKSRVLKVTTKAGEVELPLLIMPGLANETVAIPAGYGREVAGLVGTDIGQNGYKLLSFENGLVSYTGAAEIAETGRKEEVAQTQIHYTIPEDRATLKETTLDKFKENAEAGNEDRFQSNFRNAVDLTLYPDTEFPGHHWGMSIDLNSCIGCAACVVSCNVENNIPVVGKKEVAMQRDMHWLRIDRYFASEQQDPKEDGYLENPSVAFMPMMCQHCDNAPCENVCPVNATNHSSEGLNQMSYNRCIGTRYCANNCPFKVRRFNWFDYWGADAWGGVNDLDKNEVSDNMRDDLSRMILNPDVTVRSRGVIEKCSFCVQRIQAAKLDAKLEGKPLEAGAIETACQSACPTNAIVFGDTNNKESEVHQLQNSERNFFVLEEFHVLPSVGYLTKVTNSDKALFNHLGKSHFLHHGETNGHGDDHGAQTHGGDSHENNDHRNDHKEDKH